MWWFSDEGWPLSILLGTDTPRENIQIMPDGIVPITKSHWTRRPAKRDDGVIAK